MENDKKETENTLRDEFRDLGENIRSTFHSAWDSEERQRIQTDIKEGLKEVSSSVNESIKDFQSSETGQRLKQEADEFGEKINSGELESRIRTDLAKILRSINSEIASFLDREETAKPEEDLPEDKA